MSILDLNTCTEDCHKCIITYIKKHHLKKGGTFDVDCKGIPKEYISDDIISASGTDSSIAISMFDPVTWAVEFLDWYCLDPTGEHWKRKTEEGTLPTGCPIYDEKRALEGKSAFHRPYQAEMLRCSSKRKVSRIGRQAGKTEILCIVILHAIFTHENFRVVIIAPYQSQIELIFNRLNSFIEKNEILLNSRKTSNKAPNYLLQLHNGSQVRGFTAGTRSKQEAGSSRGQSAHMLIFDEADYLSAGDIDAALAIITNFPEALVWMSSTPIGRRESFYKTCHDPMFREFYFPSQVNPNWTEKLEKFFRSRLTEDGYKHEILAEFGEQEEGVYQSKYVDVAQQDYEYRDMKPEKGWLYGLGCDWNDPKIGTTIAVVGYNPNVGKFYLVGKHIISKADRTQLTACEKIAELNRFWNFKFIYADRGYGTTQIEVLKEYGHRACGKYGGQHPDSKLAWIVKPYDFGGTVEIRDLITKQPIKKHAKPFLVENSVRRFEQCVFHYPKSDHDYTAQLQGYIVDKVTDTGRFVYKAQNQEAGDHFLDAVNLALVGFTLEKTKFGKVEIDCTVEFLPSLTNNNKGNNELINHTLNEPRASRTNVQPRIKNLIMNSELPDIPGNIKSESKLWEWPGFLRDEPRPRMRNNTEGSSMSQRIFNLRSNRHKPSRSKF